MFTSVLLARLLASFVAARIGVTAGFIAAGVIGSGVGVTGLAFSIIALCVGWVDRVDRRLRVVGGRRCGAIGLGGGGGQLLGRFGAFESLFVTGRSFDIGDGVGDDFADIVLPLGQRGRIVGIDVGVGRFGNASGDFFGDLLQAFELRGRSAGELLGHFGTRVLRRHLRHRLFAKPRCLFAGGIGKIVGAFGALFGGLGCGVELLGFVGPRLGTLVKGVLLIFVLRFVSPLSVFVGFAAQIVRRSVQIVGSSSGVLAERSILALARRGGPGLVGQCLTADLFHLFASLVDFLLNFRVDFPIVVCGIVLIDLAGGGFG